MQASRSHVNPIRACRSETVKPLVRALAILSAFTTHDIWVSNKEISLRVGLPVSTVSRLLKTLVLLGYVCHSAQTRQYRLAAAVLGLGYAATSHSDIQHLVRNGAVDYAGQHDMTVLLATRDRLDVVILDSYQSARHARGNGLYAGSRFEINYSSLGYTLLAGLPELERTYLMENIARRRPEAEAELDAQLSNALRQISGVGFQYSLSQVESGMALLSVPLNLAGRGLFVLACVGSPAYMSKARVTRELGPKLVSLANQLKLLHRDSQPTASSNASPALVLGMQL